MNIPMWNEQKDSYMLQNFFQKNNLKMAEKQEEEGLGSPFTCYFPRINRRSNLCIVIHHLYTQNKGE